MNDGACASRATRSGVWLRCGVSRAFLAWAQRLTSHRGSLPPRAPDPRRRRGFSLLAAGLATYWGGAACAPPQYVANQHAAIQSPVTIGEGNTGKPALDELPEEGGPQPAAPVHPPPRAAGAVGSNAPSSGKEASAERAQRSRAGEVDVGALLGGPADSETKTGALSGPDGASTSANAAVDPTPAPFDPRATPDPEPASTEAYYELTLRYCEGGVHLVGSRRVTLAKPSTLPSYMGRFAAELWIGHELLERARFEFPGVGADSLERTEPPTLQLGPRADVVWKVKVADRVRATQAWIIDRGTGERWLLDWPPENLAAKPTADAPCPSFGGK